MRWVSGVETCALPGLRNREDAVEWHEADRSTTFSVGLQTLHDKRVLAFQHTRSNPTQNMLALCKCGDDGQLTIDWSVRLADDHWPTEAGLRKIACSGNTVLTELQPGVIGAFDLKNGTPCGQLRVAEGIHFLKPLQGTDGKSRIFVSCHPEGCLVVDINCRICGDWRTGDAIVGHLRPVEAIADDLSAVIGWRGSNRLVHVRLKDQNITELWNRFDRHGGSKSKANSVGNPFNEPTNIVSTACGRAVAFVLWDYVVVFDVLDRRPVFHWQRPWDTVNSLAFDSSGRWLVLAHDDNKFEVFQLFWDATPA